MFYWAQTSTGNCERGLVLVVRAVSGIVTNDEMNLIVISNRRDDSLCMIHETYCESNLCLSTNENLASSTVLYTHLGNHYLLAADAVFRTGFSPEENLESLSIISAGASASSRQWKSCHRWSPIAAHTVPGVEFPLMLIILSCFSALHVLPRDGELTLCQPH